MSNPIPPAETLLEDVRTVSGSRIDPAITLPNSDVLLNRIADRWPRVALHGYATALVIAADKGGRLYIDRVLRNVGCKADGFGELRAAQGALSENRYDVALMSSDQERVDWLSVVHKLRPEMPVLFILENGSSEGIARLLDAGADDCLAAPFAASDLVARVRRLLRLVWQRHGMPVSSSLSDLTVCAWRRLSLCN
jgi:DNA-binding response OmpR family regulator